MAAGSWQRAPFRPTSGSMASLPRALGAIVLLQAVTSACGQTGADRAEVQRILTELQAPDRLQQAMAAIATQHLIRRQWNVSLLARTSPRWWQRELAPGIPRLVDMLRDERGLEWVDSQGMTEQITTPRKEATLALLALERASVVPLIAALDQPDLGRKADELLRQIVGGGPPGAHGPGRHKDAWMSYWAGRQGEPLPSEQGHLWQALLIALLVAGAVTGIIWLQRRGGARAQTLPRLTIPAPGAASPSTATASAASLPSSSATSAATSSAPPKS